MFSRNCRCLTIADYAILIPKTSKEILELTQSLVEKIKYEGRGVILDTSKSNLSGKYNFYITIGANAYNEIIETKTDKPLTVIASFLPKDLYYKKTPHKTTAVFNDFNPELNLILARKFFRKNPTEIGIIHSKKSAYYVESMIKHNDSLPEDQKLHIHTYEISSSDNTSHILSTLDSEFNIDALIIQPDSDVYRSDNLKSVFYTLYKQRIGAFVYTPGLVKKGAGGLVSVYYDDTEVINQIAMYAQKYIDSGELLKQGYPEKASVKVNNRLAKSLGFIDIDEKKLEETLNNEF